MFLFIHGVGRSEKMNDYSEHMRKVIKPKEWLEFSYADLIEADYDRYFEANFKKPGMLRFKKKTTYQIRKMLFDYAADAIAYESVKERMMIRLFGLLNHVKGINAKPINIVAHSMGGVFAFDFIKQYESIFKFDHLFTMGTNLPLWKVQDRNFETVNLKDGKWTNYYEPNDVLAFPMAGLKDFLPSHQQNTWDKMIVDVEFNSKNLLKGWNVGSHLSYWTSERIGKEILSKVGNEA